MDRTSDKIQEARDLMVKAREKLAEIHGFGDRIKVAQGNITCGISYLYGVREEACQMEIGEDSRTRGPEIMFKSRGIGLDICPGCFVCGATVRSEAAMLKDNPYLHNIAAYVPKTHAKVLLAYFDGRARFEARGDDMVQFKVGACSKHRPSLAYLDTLTSSQHGVIRGADILEAKKQPEAEETE